jgi:hypothetical protein
MVTGPWQLWKIQTRPLVREGALRQEASIYQTKEHVKSGHGPQRAARHQDILARTVCILHDQPQDRLSYISSFIKGNFEGNRGDYVRNRESR